MSTHLLIAAAYLEDLPQGRKLVLMAIADSADEHTLEAAPGLPKLRAWSGLGKSGTLNAIAELAVAGLLERVEAGRLGRRAVYRVFPRGVPAIPHPDEVADRYRTGSSQQDPPDIVPIVDDAEVIHIEPAQEGPASRTHRVQSRPSRVQPAGPLQSSTSYINARATKSNSRTVDGSAATASRRRNRCPRHGTVLPCERCAYEAATADPAKIAAARDDARRAFAQALNHTANRTATVKE